MYASGARPAFCYGPAPSAVHLDPASLSFDTLGLSPEALAAVARAGYTVPTPIQLRVIPPVLAGKDVVGCAATGTGKTAAFALPIVERLLGKTGTRALVLAPTRELANQITEHMGWFGASRGVRCATVIGGVGMADQIRALRSGAHVVVATPGRLIDHLDRGTANLDRIEVLVLDEADRMLDMGFEPQLRRILARVPRVRQTLLFSATMAGEVAAFARAHLQNPVRVEVSTSGTTAARAEQRVYAVNQEEKTPLLLALLAADDASTLVFTRTKRRADRVARTLARAGHRVERIHADRSQNQREQALEGFRQGRYRVLVATDIAARGLDVAEIGHVILYDLPHVPEDYVHRIGRTARAEASGRASSFASPDESDLLAGIERLIRGRIPRADTPRDSPVFAAEMTAAAARKAAGPPSSSPRPWEKRRGPPPRRYGRSEKPQPGAKTQAADGQSSQRSQGSQATKSVFSGGPRRRRHR